MYVCVYVCMCTYIYIYIYICIHRLEFRRSDEVTSQSGVRPDAARTQRKHFSFDTLSCVIIVTWWYEGASTDGASP